MKEAVNKNLITLKCVVFCFLSGVGCIFPFLPLHMLKTGLNKGEARLISAVAPCVALLGPAILGPLLDKLSVGRGSTGAGPSSSGKLLRVVTALCLILSAVFYLLLLSIPYTERHDARRPRVLFMCDENGATVLQEVCTEGMLDHQWEGPKTGVLALTQCEYACKSEDLSWLLNNSVPTTTTTTSLPLMYLDETAQALRTSEGVEEEESLWAAEAAPVHVCAGGACAVYVPHAPRLRATLTLHAPDNHTQPGWLLYRTATPSHCSVPASHMSALQASDAACAAAARCRVLDPYDEPGGVLQHAQCTLNKGDPNYTFWTYFIVRVLSDIWPISALALLGVACVIATRETSLGRGDVGRQLAVGTIGLAIFPPLAGLAANLVPEYPYLVPFVMHAVFMVIGAAILLIDSGMPLSTPEWWWHTCGGAVALPLSAVRGAGAETAAICLVLALLGACWAAIDDYLPWTLLAYSGDETLVGLSLTVGAAPAVLALWWAENVVDYLGHNNVFIAAFAFYSLRFIGIGYSNSYEFLLALEALEVVTLSLVWVTAVLYFRHLAPRKYTSTGQALPVIAHFCLGRCIGAILGGLMPSGEEESSRRGVAGALGVAALLVAAVYLALYHLLLAPRCHAAAHKPPKALLEGLNTNGSSNGAYSPMRVYHEERSRKGHFRY